VVNISLLAKWRRRLLNGDKALWKEVLVEKYGENVCNVMEDGGGFRLSIASRWWKDIIHLEKNGGLSWFNKEVERRVRNGENTKFWLCRWRGGVSFREKYPRLFAMLNQQEAMVADIWVLNGNLREWTFSWRRRFFVWEEQLLGNLLANLEGHVWMRELDGWAWKQEEDAVFTVKSMYDKLEGLVILENNWGVEENKVFNQLGRPL